MSYGAFAKQAARYREAEVLSASPAQLVVIVYEHLLINLRRARLQLAAADAEARSESLARARAALTELLVSLDEDKGGELAARLRALYLFFLGELSVLGVKPDAQRLDAIIGLAGELHEAFAQVAQSFPSTAQAAVAAS
jgi:flagellar protein FliS